MPHTRVCETTTTNYNGGDIYVFHTDFHHSQHTFCIMTHICAVWGWVAIIVMRVRQEAGQGAGKSPFSSFQTIALTISHPERNSQKQATLYFHGRHMEKSR